VLEKYRSKQPKWPVPLTDGIKGPATGKKKPAKKASASKAAAPAASAAAEDEYIEIEEEEEVDVEVEVEIEDPMSSYYHGPIPKAGAETKLEADDGFETTGKFLFRQKGSNENKFILSVVYKGKPTHHAVERESEGEPFAVNKKDTGKTTLVELVKLLSKKQPKIKWPIALKDGVENGKPATIKTTKIEKQTRKVTKRVLAPKSSSSRAEVRDDDPRFKDEPKSNLTTTNADSGEFGFDDWDPGIQAKIDGESAPQHASSNPADQGTFLVTTEVSEPIPYRVRKRDITKTWRKKRLSYLEDGTRPTAFGDFGNLVSSDQLAKLQSIRKTAAGKSKSMSTLDGTKTLESSVFGKASALLSQTGFGLTGSSTSRMSSSFMSFDVPADQGHAVAAPQMGEITQECTFLGNCTCIDCIDLYN